jgi:tetratricopeptide (TPR) repeat protein
MSRPAAAGDEAAQAHYKKGRSLYNVSEYRAALDEFKQAYVEHEDPAFLYNIAQCHRQLGNYPEAITFYKRFLNESPKAPNRKEIQRLIAELEGKSANRPHRPRRPHPPRPWSRRHRRPSSRRHHHRPSSSRRRSSARVCTSSSVSAVADFTTTSRGST